MSKNQWGNKTQKVQSQNLSCESCGPKGMPCEWPPSPSEPAVRLENRLLWTRSSVHSTPCWLNVLKDGRNVEILIKASIWEDFQMSPNCFFHVFRCLFSSLKSLRCFSMLFYPFRIHSDDTSLTTTPAVVQGILYRRDRGFQN